MRFSSKATAALFHFLLALCLLQTLAPSRALAAMPEGTKGWWSGISNNWFTTADEACRFQWNTIGHGANSRYIGPIYWSGNPNGANCSWTLYQYLCPQETGGGITACGTSFPTLTKLECEAGYVPVQGQFCRKASDLTPERPCGCNNGSSVNPVVGHPIVVSTGAKVLHVEDYSTADGDFVIGRSYRSMPFGSSANALTTLRGLAGGWAFDFMYELQLAGFSGSPSSPNAKLSVVAPDGSAYNFVMQSGGTFVPDTATGPYYAPTNLKVEFVGTLPSDLGTLQSASTQWRVTDGTDSVWTFQTFPRPNTTPYAVGRPVSRVDRDGYRWDFAYRSDSSLQTITDSFGRQATVNWSKFYISTLANPPAGSLPYPETVASIALPDGTSLRYTYDPPAVASAPSNGLAARLMKAERLNASSTVIDRTTYAYGDSRFPQHITGIANLNGEQVASYSYDARGRGITTALASNTDSYSIANSENSTELVRNVTNALGKVEAWHFTRYGSGTDIRLTSIAGQASTNTPASTRSITYGTNNFIATETDDEGRVTTYTRDGRGRPTTIVEATGTAQQRSTTISWHSTLNVPTSIVRPGLTETRGYNSAGQLTMLTLTDTTSQSVPYSTNGQTRTWTYDWTTKGRLLSINGPLAVSGGQDDITSFTYDTQGNTVLTSTNAAGQVTTFANYDANGRPGTVTDPNGLVMAFTYDGMGRVQTINARHVTTSSLDAITTIAYDNVGRVSGITLPSTDILYMDYDTASRLIAIRAANGERRDYLHDEKGNVTRETVKRTDGSISRQITRTFDELGRLLTRTMGVPHTSRWSYDKVGNVTQIQAPSGSATTQAFDALNRLVTTIAPDTGSSTRAYDPLDNLTTHTDPKSVTTQFVRNGFGEVIQETSPDRGTSTYWYDAAGELIQSQDGRGQTVTYTRDFLGRLTQKAPTGLSGETVSYSWDTPGISGSYGVGHLSSVTDPTGTTSFAYDHRGNLITRRQTIGSGTADLAYAYDLADRITQIAYPSGRLVQYGYDSKGRVSQVQTKASASDPSWTVLASGLSYEPFGSVKAMTLGNGLSVANDWGNDGRLASRRLYQTSGGTSLSWLGYGYDGNDNIGSIRDLVDDTKSVYYGYDANDRIALMSMVAASAPAAETLAYTSGTNRLASVTTAAGTRSISYDGRGNTSAETRPASISVSTGYDGYGRLLTYSRTGDPAQTNAYNGLDDRVSVTSGSTTHAFVYDGDGRVLGEYGTSGSDVIAETIWLSPEVASGNTVFGGDDGVGGYAPLAVVTGSGTSATLTWVHGNHLGVPVAFTNAGGTAVSTPSYTLPGFPGQTKTLSDLYYNRYRDYDSSTGRYIQADPIGLGGGNNPYLYAEANPLRFVDPDGRSPIIIGIAIGIGVELGIQAYQNYKMRRNVLDWRCYDVVELAKQGLYGAAFGAAARWIGGWEKLTAGSMKWNNASRRIRRAEDLIGKDIDLHHWALPQKWGDGAGGWRDAIINRPWNLNPLPRKFHQAIHQANPFSTFVRGSPSSIRDAVAAGTAGGIVDATHDIDE